MDASSRANVFEEIMRLNNTSLYGLSKKMNCGYSALKNWRTGKRLIPENMLNKLSDLGNEDTQKLISASIQETYPTNWGTILGGETFYKKYKRQISSKMEYARSFIKTATIPEINEEIWELFGICLGDGCLSNYLCKGTGYFKHEVIFTGHSKDVYDYYNSYLIPSLKSHFNIKITPQFRENVIYLRINNQKVFSFFKDLGMSVGKKKSKIKIPKAIISGFKTEKAAILRGLLDMGGCIFGRKDEGYKYPHIKITSANKDFLFQIRRLIYDFGLSACVHWQGNHGGDVIVRGSNNVRQWMSFIGTSHPIILQRYTNWTNTGMLLPKGLVAQ